MQKSSRQRTLVLQAQSGDHRAFEEIFGEHRERLRGFIASRIGPTLARHLEAEDVLQDTAAKSFELIARFEWRGPDSFFRWLKAIAEHLILNATQKHRRAPMELEREVVEARAVSPSRTLRREERFERLDRALERLSPEQRRAILLARIEGLRVAEVAERLGKSSEAVKKMISRGLKRLRDGIGETESLHLPDRRLEEGQDP